ncbi:MAG: redoxin domain-containing protein [Blastocatellia bacterium]|nr:redoxin domain-containing protein [Blastocatellia bacterium]
MRRKGILFVAIISLFAFTISPAATGGEFAVGSKLDNFKMTGTDGKEHSFKDLQGKNGTVVVFLSAQCPVVKAYITRIDEIAADYKAKGINFIGINSNHRDAESLEWVTKDAAENFKFPMLVDTDNVLADKLGASVTPEVYYFNADSVLVYHGAIDNDRSGRNIEEQYLKTAFDAALAGKTIEKSRTNAFGCTIKRVEKATAGN